MKKKKMIKLSDFLKILDFDTPIEIHLYDSDKNDIHMGSYDTNGNFEYDEEYDWSCGKEIQMIEGQEEEYAIIFLSQNSNNYDIHITDIDIENEENVVENVDLKTIASLTDYTDSIMTYDSVDEPIALISKGHISYVFDERGDEQDPDDGNIEKRTFSLLKQAIGNSEIKKITFNDNNYVSLYYDFVVYFQTAFSIVKNKSEV